MLEDLLSRILQHKDMQLKCFRLSFVNRFILCNLSNFSFRGKKKEKTVLLSIRQIVRNPMCIFVIEDSVLVVCVCVCFWIRNITLMNEIIQKNSRGITMR